MGGENPYIQPANAPMATQKFKVTFLPENVTLEVDPRISLTAGMACQARCWIWRRKRAWRSITPVAESARARLATSMFAKGSNRATGRPMMKRTCSTKPVGSTPQAGSRVSAYPMDRRTWLWRFRRGTATWSKRGTSSGPAAD